MSRKMIGVSEALHEELSTVAKKLSLPMTIIIETLLGKVGQVNWEDVSKEHESNKPTWENIRRSVQEYQVKFPKADDQKLAELTGFSIKQIEIVTHSAHKRVIEFVGANKRMKPKRIAEECGVTEKFVIRVLGQMSGEDRIPKGERYLFEDSK